MRIILGITAIGILFIALTPTVMMLDTKHGQPAPVSYLYLLASDGKTVVASYVIDGQPISGPWGNPEILFYVREGKTVVAHKYLGKYHWSRTPVEFSPTKELPLQPKN